MKFLFFCLSLCLSLAAQAQQAYFSNLKEAQAANKPILMVFAGSDWCRPCIQFKKSILETPEFQAYAKEELSILYLDFPAKKKNQLPKEQKAQNEALAARYNGSGAFPKLVLLSPEEKVLGEVAFKNQTPEAFIEQCKAALQE